MSELANKQGSLPGPTSGLPCSPEHSLSWISADTACVRALRTQGQLVPEDNLFENNPHNHSTQFIIVEGPEEFLVYLCKC